MIKRLSRPNPSSPPHVPPVSQALVNARTLQEYKPLIHQLRFLFGLDNKEGENISDEDILYFGKVFYANENEAFAKMVIEDSRESGSRRFILAELRDFLGENAGNKSACFGNITVNCSVSDELPERLRVINEILCFARNNRDSRFARGLAQNQNFIPSPDDITFARNNRNSDFAWGLAQNQNFIPNHDDITFARNNRGSNFARELVKNQNFIPDHDDITFTRNNSDSLVAWGLAGNQNFIPDHYDIAFTRNNRNSDFAWGLAENPNIFYPEFET